MMTAQQYQFLDSTTTSRSSPTLHTAINSSRPSQVEEQYSGTDTRLQSSNEHANLADHTAINITIRYPPCQHDLDFILYPSSESLGFDSQSTSHASTAQSDTARCAWDNTQQRQCSKYNLERYTQCEEDFEKVALCLETRRASRSVLDPKLLEILDSL